MKLPTPYYDVEGITLYHGRMEEIVPLLLAAGQTMDAIVTDPPYNETACEWDRWPVGWPGLVAPLARQMWCFGSMRMFLEKVAEYAQWTFSQDIVWKKHNGSNARRDRFRRVHEQSAHWYRGDWDSLYINVPRFEVSEDHARKPFKRTTRPQHWSGMEGGSGYNYDGTRQQISVIEARSCHGYAVNETQKPEAIVAPLVECSVPMGGMVFDPFCGSGTTLLTARRQGKRAVGIELREEQCEHVRARLAQRHLDFGSEQVEKAASASEVPLL